MSIAEIVVNGAVVLAAIIGFSAVLYGLWLLITDWDYPPKENPFKKKC